jgi:hypothetical protein
MKSLLAQPQVQAAALAALADLMEEEEDARLMTGIFLEKDQLLSQKTGIKANGKKAPVNRKIIFEAGGMEAGMCAMKVHASDQAVQEAACKLFCNLVYEEEENICERALKIDVMGRVFVALRERQGGWEGKLSFEMFKSESEFVKACLQTLARIFTALPPVGSEGEGWDESTAYEETCGLRTCIKLVQ